MLTSNGLTCNSRFSVLEQSAHHSQGGCCPAGWDLSTCLKRSPLSTTHWTFLHTTGCHVSMLNPAYDNGSGEGRFSLIMIDGKLKEETELQTILQHRPLNKINWILASATWSSRRNMALSTTVENLRACSRPCCRLLEELSRLVLLCKQLVLGWHPIKLLLPLETGVLN